MLKTKGFIGVAFHKKFFSYKDDIIVPIHVGSKKSKENLEYLKDSLGDNISEKNKNFCELTGIYWMWKNVDANFYGMMHYRRYISLERIVCFFKAFLFKTCNKYARYERIISNKN